MVWKKSFFVLGCCLTLTILSTSINNISAADKFGNRYLDNGYNTHGSRSKVTASQVIGTMLTASLGSHISKMTLPVFEDFFMMNAGLPYDQIKDTAVWGKYICFVNKSLACLDSTDPNLDSTDPKNPVKTIYPFDLLKGDLVYEDITDMSAKDDALYVATNKNIYKFVLAENGKIAKSIELEKGALQVTAYKGGAVYLDSDGVLSGTSVSIPAFNSGIKDLFSTKNYILIAGENGIYRWKPGLGSWEPVLDCQTILGIAPGYKNDELFAIKSDGGSKIMHCLLKPEIKCSEFEPNSGGEIVNVFLDGERLYKVENNDISWADKNAENPFFNYVASTEAAQDIVKVAKVINKSIFAYSQSGIKVFIDKGLDAPSEWSKKLIKPSMLSVKGGSFTKPWIGGLFLLKEKVLYRKVNSTWEKKLDNVSDFAVTGNYGLIYNGGKLDLIDFADIFDGVPPDIHHSITSSASVTALAADAEKVFIATPGHLHECPLPIDNDIDLNDLKYCNDVNIGAVVNDMTSIAALEEEVLVCAENGIYRWVKGTDNLKLFINMPCNAATFVDGDLYVTNDMGEILMLDDDGKAVKQLCEKLQPMKGGLEANGNAFYISDLKRGVVVADKKLFTDELCPATEAPAPEPYVLISFDPSFIPDQLCNNGMCGMIATEKECTNDADCPTGKVCKSDMCIDDISAVNGATGVIDENGNSSATDPCKQELEIEETNSVPSGDDKLYDYNASVLLNFKVKNVNPDDIIEWTVSRNTAVYYTNSGKQYVYKWNEDVPVPSDGPVYCKVSECPYDVKFRLGNSKEYKADAYKTRLSIIDYFKHKITVTATREQNQCETKSVTATKELKFKFNKPKLEDEAIYGSVLAFKSYVEWVNSGTGLVVAVEDADHDDLGGVFKTLGNEYEEGHVEVIKPLLWPKSKDFTFKDVKFFEWTGNDNTAPDLYFNLNYLLLAGKDVYAIVGSGWDKMVVDGDEESWHWKEGVDFTWFMRCHPDDEDSGEPNMAEMLACGEEQGGGNM